MKVLLLYKLQDPALLAEFLKWSTTRDQPVWRRAPGVREFRVLQLEAQDGQVTIAEMFDVESWDVWQSAMKSPELAVLAVDFKRFADVSTLVQLQGEEVR